MILLSGLSENIYSSESSYMNISIVQASINHDPREIARVINQAYANVPYIKTGASRATPEAIAAMITDPNKKLFLCLHNADICGTALLDITEPNKPEMGIFAINPAYQGKAIGIQLLQYVQDQAVNTSDYLYIHVIPLMQAKLVAYYERQGFIPTEEIGHLSEDVLHSVIKPEYWDLIYYRVYKKKL